MEQQKNNKIKKPPVWLIVIAVFFVFIAIWWIVAAPPKYIKISEPIILGDIPPEMAAVKARGDPIAEYMITDLPELPGNDEYVFMDDKGYAYVSCMDGWIWRVDLKANKAEPFVNMPLMPAGMRRVTEDSDYIAVCCSCLYGEKYPDNERVGVYLLNVETKEVSLLFDRVPIIPEKYTVPAGNHGVVYAGPYQTVVLNLSQANEQNSRPAMFCNGVDVSADGNRFYFSEPFPYEGASMGGGTFHEALAMGKNGRLWCYDREANTMRLIGEGYHFVDGVLLEYKDNSERETSVLVSETIRFQITRLHLSGEKAGQDEIIITNLPGMCDGLSRDEYRNVWGAMLKPRSNLMGWVHANPWAKKILLRIPRDWLPVGKATGILALSPDCSEVLYYTMYEGPKIDNISIVNPYNGRIYFTRFNKEEYGWHYMDNPLKP